MTEPWAPHSHLRLVALLRDLFWELVDLRTVTWIHVRSHGRENDPHKRHLLPLNERADRLAERGRSGAPCFVLRRWVYTIGEDEPELAVERCRFCRRIFFLRLGQLTFMRLVVACVGMLDLPFLVVSVGCCLHASLVGRFEGIMNNIAWVVRLQTSLVALVALFLCICRLGGCTSATAQASAQMLLVICLGLAHAALKFRCP